MTAPKTKGKIVVVGDNTYIYPALSPKMESFAEQLIPCKFVLTTAMDNSLYAKGKRESSQKHASQLWANPLVREWISVRIQQIKDSLPMEQSIEINEIRVIEELCAIGFTHLGQLVDWDGEGVVTIRGKEQLTPAELASIKKIKCQVFETVDDQGEVTSRRTNIELEQHPKIPALEMLAKLHYKWYQHKGTAPEDPDDKKRKGYIVVPSRIKQ